MSNTTKTGRPHEEDVIRYDENGDPLKTPIYPDEVTEQWMTGGTTTPAAATTGTTATPTTPTTPVTTPSGTTPSGTTPTTTVPATEAATPTAGTAPEAGATAPATTPTTPTTPTMTYEQFLTQQYETAKQTAATERARAEAAAETARQKQIIDANSAYQKSLATYGANAEAAGSMGLTGSGYGEYLTGKAYATQRGEVASANRTAAALKEQALYNEQSAVDNATRIYTESMLNRQESENQKGENAYTSLSNMAAGGATLEQITNSADWGRLTPEQQTVISRTVSEKTLMSRLEAGESLESLMLTDDWNALDDAAKAKITSYVNNAQNKSNYETVLGYIASGMMPETIEKTAAYRALTDQSLINDINTRISQRRESDEATEDTNYRSVLGLIGSTPTSTIKNLKAYKDIKNPELKAELDKLMDEADATKLTNDKTARTEELEDVIDEIAFGGNVSISDLKLSGEEKQWFWQRFDNLIKTELLVDPDNAVAILERNYANGNISRDAYYTYNSTLLDGAYKLSDITADNCGEVIDLIDDFLSAGKISEEEAGVRKREAVSSFAKSELPNVTRDGERLKFKGGEYKIKSTANDQISKILDASVGTSKIPEYAIAYYDDNLYAYVDGEWHKIKHKSGDDSTEDINNGDEKTQYRDAGGLEGGYGPAVTTGPVFKGAFG